MPPLTPSSALADLIRPDGVGKVRYEGRESLRRIFVTVRDSQWAEIPPVQYESSIDESTGTALLRARHISARVAFEWEGTLSVSRDSRELRFAMKGKALREMDLCRLGLVILHPVETMVGSQIVTTNADAEQSLTVSDQIAPQPVVNGIPMAMTEPFSQLHIQRADFGALTLSFQGDFFELEDQRNWGDASFKTYCTPLRLGYPRRIEAGSVIEQTVEVRYEPATTRSNTARAKQQLGILPSLDGSARRGFEYTRGYFVELNRGESSATRADGVAFPLTATVHSDDAETIGDNVSAIVSMAETARKVTGYTRIAIAPLALYYPPNAGPMRFPTELIRPWLVATLIYSAVARIEWIVLSEDIAALATPLRRVSGSDLTLIEATGLHAARFTDSGLILAANLNSSPVRLGEIEIPPFAAVWIDGETIVDF
jgi:hypothetical protein